MKHVYISHPLGQGLSRRANRLNAKRWVKWAAEQGVVPHAVWIILSELWPESAEKRVAGLRIDCAEIDRCDELWICGHKISEGMQIEIRHAESIKIPVIDMRHKIVEVY